jgi:hypothetical protein
MEPLTLKTASRFSRATPLFVNDPMVAKAINDLADKQDVKDEAKKLEAAVTNLSEIKYVNLELQKRYGFSNNLKLMMANKTIFNALLNSCLKSGTLDLEDFDYINVNLREAAKAYNKRLISAYASFVLVEKGKTYKDEVQDLAKLKLENDALKVKETQLSADLASAKASEQKLTADLASAKASEQRLTADLVTAKAREQQLTTDLASAKASEQQLTADLGSAIAGRNQLEADLEDAKAEISRLTQSEEKLKRIATIANNGRSAADVVREIKQILEPYVSTK